MSTIKVDNIRIASESVSRPATGVAAAWVLVFTNFEILGNSLNVTSVTDITAGDPNQWNINLTSAMSDNNYTALATAQSSSDRTMGVINNGASQFRNYVYKGDGGATSVVGQNAVFGELA